MLSMPWITCGILQTETSLGRPNRKRLAKHPKQTNCKNAEKVMEVVIAL
jgi:hypothetical protein